MPEPLRICVLLPVFNHPATVGAVVREARCFFPIFVVDDGSADETRVILEQESGIHLIRFSVNRGKADALRTGFRRALDEGFTHAITIDADGQHPVEALPRFADACREAPDALIVGTRDFTRSGAPLLRRCSNALSSLCFRLETRYPLRDTLCGFRAYPLARVLELPSGSDGYAFELEVLVQAVWHGVKLVPLSVQADYASPGARVSHFRPIRDFLVIARLHLQLLSRSALGARRR
jgi:glycosyltransferase involved in cell wall biosynthesis